MRLVFGLGGLGGLGGFGGSARYCFLFLLQYCIKIAVRMLPADQANPSISGASIINLVYYVKTGNF